jgi:hypothetical protein
VVAAPYTKEEEIRMSRTYTALVAAGVLVGTATSAMAAITGPVWEGPDYRNWKEYVVTPLDSRIIEGGPGFGALSDTYSHASLTPDYVSHGTRWNTYFDALPTHTNTFSGFEWFSELGSTTATVQFYVEAAPGRRLNAFALWNEESSGIGAFDLYSPTGELLLYDINPTDNADVSPGGTYLSQQWGGKVTPDGWYTLVMRDCPQPLPGSFASCAIGEVAWGEVPEPSSLALMMLGGVGLIGASLRRRQQKSIGA